MELVEIMGVMGKDWMNQTMKDSWLMMGLEIFVGILIYIILIWMLRAPIIEQATDLTKKKLFNKE